MSNMKNFPPNVTSDTNGDVRDVEDGEGGDTHHPGKVAIELLYDC